MTRRPVDHTDAPVVGYTDRLSVRPGERVRVHASSTDPDVRVRLLLIDHDGTAAVRVPVAAGLPERVTVPHQELALGSYGLVPTPPVFDGAVTFAVWVWPTALPEGRAGLLTQAGVAELVLDADGRVGFTAHTGQGAVTVTASAPLRVRRWYLLTGSYSERGVRLEVRPGAPLGDERPATVVVSPARGDLSTSDAPLVFAARSVDRVVTDHYDGKLSAPCVFDRALDAAQVTELAADTTGAWHRGARAQWDLAQDIGGDRLLDLVDGLHGTLHNGPLRGVTAHDWTGEVLDWRFADTGYGAVHFHSDDLEDAGWDPVLTVELPADLPGGCYAVELASPLGVDRLPLFVRPPEDAPRAPIAFLVPTLSYLAYALEHVHMAFLPEDPAEVAAPFARRNSLHSLYDRHRDGSGAATASLRRPLLGVRDDHVFRHASGPHQYSEDLHLVGWLGRQGFQFDLVTDHDLDREGAAALDGYSTVVTGSHPEYWTGSMLDAATAHLHGGGKLAYLGGNGAYWVTAVHPEKPHVAELRRGYAGVRMWESEPGELVLASTGEPGGLWSERGRSPHRLFGIGTTAAGLTTGGSYEVLARFGDPVIDRLLRGVDRNAPLGAFGALLGGAASFETDGFDLLQGSPPNTRLIARALLGESYMSADTGPTTRHPMADPVDHRRSDLTLLDTPGGGTVFATGSIGWCAALSHAGDANDVSKLTAAVLRSFTGKEF
ncbi:N,N-dimethylformamidase beta subunit family domain-containing protein [Actinokineospora sp. NBRC 105648]|uniref:N,N-dimethylformamidase beta subunit family domain-containing protein n=1 Tax=Actinokineospora sp. NBRC 105648 TaxID=3032206 RepID=UPI0024A230F0|nr:N,N-dimethylformamidase beta subunit family domain-containing protein [Actinokineospora sp. NBRC 105648]GLZ41360.1 large subunit of N,N-dimethylformamidase [Actinokineospora sp. NBRC 105648]